MHSCETDKAINVIFCFNTEELAKVKKLKQDLWIQKKKDIIVIDCRCDKHSASKVKCDSEV